MKEKNHSKTLNLPKTKFSMKANLVQKERDILKFWDENNTYEKSLKDGPSFILHDGPPYANGDIHLGTALTKILKDAILKYKRFRGFKSKFVPGWDTHGLPIEVAVLKKDGGVDSNPIMRKKFKSHALKFVERQKKDFIRLGVLGEWDRPYLTLDKEFEWRQLEIFTDLLEKGYVFYEYKPVYWSVGCETALAEAEIEYHDHTSPSIYVEFKSKSPLLGEASFAIWTTTPWTLPANVAIAVNKDFEYSLMEIDGKNLVVATELVDKFTQEIGAKSIKVKKTFMGAELEGLEADHPFANRISKIILGDHVTLEAGTGCVHTAPGHGQEDFFVGKQYELDVLCPVDGKGYLTEEAGEFSGMFYEDANGKIIESLKNSGHLLGLKNIVHSYPHCWRSKKPIIFRATLQCFIDVEKSGLRGEALSALSNVSFTPKWSVNRISSMVEQRPDWCISRQRSWGVPIPVVFDKESQKPLPRVDISRAITSFVREHGIDRYLEAPLKEVLDGIKDIDLNGYEKGSDVMDVWFDSGATHHAVLNEHYGLSFPADLYSEGSDQHRGWFQTSLLTSVAQKGVAPYKHVLTNGFVVDAKGMKMSKSLGNVILPSEVIDKYGADILRLWVFSSDYTSDIRVSEEILEQVANSYKKIRNSIRFAIGNLYDFDPSKDMIGDEDLMPIDKIALERLELAKSEITKHYESYEIYKACSTIMHFLSAEMSSIYFDILKDRLYTSNAKGIERRSGQSILYKFLIDMVKAIAPILSFTAEEIWRSLFPEKGSIFQEEWFSTSTKQKSGNWEKLIAIRGLVNRHLELAKESKDINSSLEASVDLFIPDNFRVKDIEEYLEEIFIVSNVTLHQQMDNLQEDEGFGIRVTKFGGTKCSRCWKYYEDQYIKDKEEELCLKCSTLVG